MVTNLRSPVAQWLYLTDASLQRGGITRAPLSPSLGAELWRFGDLRGRHSWLAPCSVYSDVIAKLGRVLSPLEAAFSAIATSLPHRVVANYRFRTPHHITLQECLVYRALMVHAGAELSLHDHRLVNGFDSQAVCGAAAKGRSSSHRVNRILAQAAAHRLGAGVQLGNFFIPIELIVADDLTRCAPLRAAEPPPPWVDYVGPPPLQDLLAAATMQAQSTRPGAPPPSGRGAGAPLSGGAAVRGFGGSPSALKGDETSASFTASHRPGAASCGGVLQAAEGMGRRVAGRLPPRRAVPPRRGS